MSEEKVVTIDTVSVGFLKESDGSTLLCRVSGQLETSNSPGFLDTVKDELGRQGIKKMVLELSGLTYVSSTGIGSFTTLLIECKKKGVSLVLKNISEKVKSVFDLLGFTSFFDLE